MSCTFERERLALYFDDELTGTEAHTVTDHLASCPDCRRVLTEYQQGAALLREAVTAVPAVALAAPRTGPRITLTAAVAVAVALVLLLVATGPALADVLQRSFSLFRVTELNPVQQENVRALLDGHAASLGEAIRRLEPGQLLPGNERVTRSEAMVRAGYLVPEPGYLPEGFKPVEIFLVEGRIVHQVFAGPPDGGDPNTIYLYQYWRGYTRNPSFPEGAVSAVRVNGADGLLIRGAWTTRNGGPVTWEPNRTIALYFEWNGQFTELHARGDLPEAELIRIAESLR